MKDQTLEAAVDQSRVEQLVGLLEKSAEAWGRVGPFGAGGTRGKIYSYMDYIEKRVVNKMPHEVGTSAICDAWNSLTLGHDDDAEGVAESVQLANPRLPEKARAELGRRVQADAAALAEARPIYDEIIAFLDLDWAFEDRQPGCCADPIDEAFLDSVDAGDVEPYVEVIGGYEDPFGTVDDSIAWGPATTEEAEKLIALAQTVNAARAEYRGGRQMAMGAAAGAQA